MFTAMNVVRTAYHDRIVAALSPPRTRIEVDRAPSTSSSTRARDHGAPLPARLRGEADRARAAHPGRPPHRDADDDRRASRTRSATRSTPPSSSSSCSSAGCAAGRRPTPARAERSSRRTRSSGSRTLLNDFLAFARPPELHTERARRRRDRAPRGRARAGRPPSARARRSSSSRAGRRSSPRSTRPSFIRSAQPRPQRDRGGRPRAATSTVELVGGRRPRSRSASRTTGRASPRRCGTRIYEPFFSTKEGGTGLGMSIVHSLVSLHGGTIDIDTSPHGTRFESRSRFARSGSIGQPHFDPRRSSHGAGRGAPPCDPRTPRRLRSRCTCGRATYRSCDHRGG